LLNLCRSLFYAQIVALDCLLYLFTFFPLRVVMAVVALFLSRLPPLLIRTIPRSVCSVLPLRFQAVHLFDLMRMLVLVIVFSSLCYLDLSRMYHQIRGQGTIKLYIMTNMMEICDKLMCSLGQDVLDSLYISTCVLGPLHKGWTARRRMRVLGDFCVTAFFSVIHAVITPVFFVSLQIALHSNDTGLLLLVLVKNNFNELKKSVFKSVDEWSLFQHYCADACERVNLLIMLLLVCHQSYCAGHTLYPIPTEPYTSSSSHFFWADTNDTNRYFFWAASNFTSNSSNLSQVNGSDFAHFLTSPNISLTEPMEDNDADAHSTLWGMVLVFGSEVLVDSFKVRNTMSACPT
jgi:hypothetical protein